MKKIKKNESSKNNCWNTIGVWSGASDKCEKLVEHVHCRNCPVFSTEGKRVLDRFAPVGYLKEWKKTLSTTKKKENVDNKSVLIFRVGGEWFALPASTMQEITEVKTVHRIPSNKSYDISGVVNIGGEIRICYSLVSIFGIKMPHNNERKYNAVINGRFIVAVLGNNCYVFPVDQVSGLCWYNDSDVLPVPATLEYAGNNMLLGVINHNKNNVAVLDADMFRRNLERIAL